MRTHPTRQHLSDAKRTRAVAAAATIGVTGLMANPAISGQPAAADASRPVMANLPPAATPTRAAAIDTPQIFTRDTTPADPENPTVNPDDPTPSSSSPPSSSAPPSSAASSVPTSSVAPVSSSTTTTTTTTPPNPGTTAPPSTAPKTSDVGVEPTLPSSVPVSTDPTVESSVPESVSTSAPETVTVLEPPAPAALGIPVTKTIADILRTIRILESNENYSIGKNKGGASGAYQYIDPTWNNYKGYPSAYLAPPEIQDEKAALDVNAILSTWGGDVSMVPVIWYYPKAAYDPTLMDLVPMPQAGNRFTIREYQTKWLRIYSGVSGTQIAVPAAPVHEASLAGEPPVLQRNWGPFVQIAYPLLGPSTVEPQVCDASDPVAVGATGQPAAIAVTTSACATVGEVVINGQAFQPVVAVADGVIAQVTGVTDPDDATNDASTVDTVTPPVTVGLTIIDADGRSYTYSGFNDGSNPAVPQFSPLVEVGGRVRAGQVLGYLGGDDADRPVPTPVDDATADPTADTVDTIATTDEPAAAPIDESSTDDAATSSTTTTTVTTVAAPADAPAADPAAATNPPQLRLAIRSRIGQPLDAEGLVNAALVRQSCDVAVGPWSTAATTAVAADAENAPAADVALLPAVVPVIGGSESDNWLIAPNGALSAQGLASMIVSPTGCSLVPTELFGPGASGNATPAAWTDDIDVSTRYVVDMVAEQARTESPGVAPKVRR